MDSKILKGTTTLGIACKDGLILATDKRASWGSFIASKQARKVFALNNQVGATIAGSVGDAESLMRLIQAEASLYEISHGKPMSAQAISTLLSNILQGNKIFPYLVQLIVAGYAKDQGAQLYTLDPIGGLIQEDMAATGSGSPMAYGVLENKYDKEKTVEENIPVALAAMKSALSRDSASGDGLSMVTITDGGLREYSEEEIQKHLQQLSKLN